VLHGVNSVPCHDKHGGPPSYAVVSYTEIAMRVRVCSARQSVPSLLLLLLLFLGASWTTAQQLQQVPLLRPATRASTHNWRCSSPNGRRPRCGGDTVTTTCRRPCVTPIQPIIGLVAKAFREFSLSATCMCLTILAVLRLLVSAHYLASLQLPYDCCVLVHHTLLRKGGDR
jgi:hypothetical protein